MSATDELRRMLDERGLTYEECEDCTTIYYDKDGSRYTYNVEPKSGWAQLFGYHITPEKAIAATVERGTCHTVSMDCFGNPPYNKSGLNGNDPACGCSECGAPWSTTGMFRGNKLRHNFKACPICGRKVVE